MVSDTIRVPSVFMILSASFMEVILLLGLLFVKEL